MSKQFVLINYSDNSLVQSSYRRTVFKQRAAALRMAKKMEMNGYGGMIRVMSYDDYVEAGYDKQTRRVRNFMTGEMVDEPINTPYCCSVASETYWSM